MPPALPAHPLRLFANPRAAREAPYSDALRGILNLAAGREAQREISGWPGYRPTPLHALQGLARAAGIAALWYKDEGGRFGLGSFKALGGAYAVLRLLQRTVAEQRGGQRPEAAELAADSFRPITRAVTVATATDGNHGRAVAWGANRFGCRSVIYLHEHVSPGRISAIAALGAEVVRVPGTYDDSVRAAARDAKTNGWHMISDTSYPGYMEVPLEIMQGYSVIASEVQEQLSSGGDSPRQRPTHVFVQGGVGGLAAAICAHLWESWGAARPRFAVAEPERADCLYRSAVAGEPVVVEGDLDTIMAGLACGEVSLLAWEVLREGAHHFLTLPDAAAVDTMRLLAAGRGEDPPIVAGESAVAGLAGLLCALADGEAKESLALDTGSRVLVIGSEGATDPAVYKSIVGRAPEEVAGERPSPS